MWLVIANILLRFRFLLMSIILGVTIVMGYYASKVEMSYEFSRTVPLDDPDMIFLNKFKNQFGEDDNLIVLGLKDSSVYKLKDFKSLRKLTDELLSIEGVKDVLSLPNLKIFLKDTLTKKFVLSPLFPDSIKTQSDLDSLLTLASDQKLYSNQIFNKSNGALLILIGIKKNYAHSVKRIKLTNTILKFGGDFDNTTGIKLRYAGLPFIHTVVAEQVRKELSLFLILSAIITGLIMLLFFRTYRAVIFSLIMIGIMVIWTLGTIAILGYKISMLSGVIPPLIVIIGITNAIYLLNKYHLEFQISRNKQLAIKAVVEKMGLATFLTNLTVAIGFFSLAATDIIILREFGLVAGINILALFVVSLTLIPSILSILPEPSSKHLQHLSFPLLNGFIKWVNHIVLNQRKVIYSISIVLATFSVVYIWGLQSVAFMVDDLPAESQIKKDLLFFENNFSGVMPLEIEVELDTKQSRPFLDISNLKAIDAFENSLDSIEFISPPISIVSLVKAFRQAMYNNNPDRYALPTKQEMAFILRYLKGQKDNNGLIKSFIDSTFHKVRISLKMADKGSKVMDALLKNVVQPKADTLVSDLKKTLRSASDSVIVTVTGSSKLFIKGSQLLIKNLVESIILAVILITLSMALLFANVRTIAISLIPNILALMITAGLMGYLDIQMKASTALIFSITFGISIDSSIRFLAKYRQELKLNGYTLIPAVYESVTEAGKSIVYTTIVLFAGFIIFAFSDFGGIIALGILTSVTLFISMFTNLILLPALILTFDKPKPKNGPELIDEFDNTTLQDFDNMNVEDKDENKIKSN